MLVRAQIKAKKAAPKMKQSARKQQGEESWPKAVFKKWLKARADESDYSADEGDYDDDYDDEGEGEARRGNGNQAESRFDRSQSISCKLRRRNSETLRAQYINTKEIRVCVGTWNVAGKHPPDDLNIDEWLDMREPADVYVLGLQEIVPLNAGSILRGEDSGAVAKWQGLIRDALNRIRPQKPKYKCYSDPPSPSRFRPSDGGQVATVDELLPETDRDTDDDQLQLHLVDDDEEEDSFASPGSENAGCYPIIDEENCNADADTGKSAAPFRRLQRLHHFTSMHYEDSNPEAANAAAQQKKLMKTLSSSERTGLVWPEQSQDLLAKCAADSMNPLRTVKSFRACSSFKSVQSNPRDCLDIGLIPEYNWDEIVRKKWRSPFVRIASKQMVGIYLSIWARRSLRKRIQNLKVSTVGVGIMGYIGNKGSVSVSMSIYQTPFCFICTHLSAGEKSGDELRRNSDVQEIHRRTRFSTVAGLPRTILDHERIFWFGDLNYRINLSYERTHELISKKKKSELGESDQLKRELKKGRAFDGWSEGVIEFPPTYKYEFNSKKYIGDDLKGGKRTPAWCDRILSFGTGIRLLSYRSSELTFSDHRPVTATYMAEVEVFSHRKLQRALTLTDAEVEDGEIIADMDIAAGMGLVY